MVVGGLNARQAFCKARGSISKGHLTPPNPCQGKPPDEVNVYSDGSYQFSRRPTFGLGAAGAWWPSRTLEETCLSEAEFEIAMQEQQEKGVRLRTSLPGFGSSSTRDEIAAGIIALASSIPVNIGSDSQAFIDKGNAVIRLARQKMQPKKPWGSPKDGDLWSIFHKFVLHRGWGSVRLTKVKGHSTEEQVRKGQVSPKDKDGNDKADEAAKDAMRLHGEGVVKLANWYMTRHVQYTRLIKDIHTHLIEGTVLRKKLVQEKQDKEKKRRGIFQETESKAKWVSYGANSNPNVSQVSWQKLQFASSLSLVAKQKARAYLLFAEVGKFLQNVELSEPENEAFGTTWLEFFLLFKKLGGKDRVEYGRAAKAKEGAGKKMQIFQRHIRFIAKHCLVRDEQRKLFKPGTKKGYALRRLRIQNHMATLNLRSNLPEEARGEIDCEILIANGNRREEVGAKPSAGMQGKDKKLLLKSKGGWIEALKVFKPEVTKKFHLADVTLFSNLQWLRTRKCLDTKAEVSPKVPKRPGLSHRPCVHDFVQPIVASRGVKRACTDAPQRGRPILRIGMLNARLKERFAHLCTDG